MLFFIEKLLRRIVLILDSTVFVRRFLIITACWMKKWKRVTARRRQIQLTEEGGGLVELDSKDEFSLYSHISLNISKSHRVKHISPNISLLTPSVCLLPPPVYVSPPTVALLPY
jgi:hypothetical protein